jgi:putative ABC transport system permease protein
VLKAALVRGLPFSGNGGSADIEIIAEPAPEKPPRARTNTVDPAYFETMGIALVRGRVFSERDAAGTPPVVVVSRKLAERHWPGADPLGQKIRLLGLQPPLVAEVIGIVATLSSTASTRPSSASSTAPRPRIPTSSTRSRSARQATDAARLRGSGRGLSVDPEQPVWKVRTQQSLVERAKGMPRSWRSSWAATRARAAARGGGLYGVTSYAVTQRTREIGLRMALGAETSDVLRIVLRRGLLLACLGLALGLAGALALGRVVQSLLFATSPTDAVTLVGVAFLLLSVALLASYLPARRATRVDPTVALRTTSRLVSL